MNYKNPHSILVVIYAKNTQRVLMLQRKDDPDFWQSVTGSINIGETPLEAAEREVSEETGLQTFEQKQPLVDCQKQIEFEIFRIFGINTHLISHIVSNIGFCCHLIVSKSLF